MRNLFKNIALSFSFLFMVATITSCSEKDLTTSSALRSIESYLEYKPQYESTTIQLGETKLKTQKDTDLIAAYKDLETTGLLALETKDLKKKWLSKDSIWNVNLKLTDLAAPYVIDQKNNKVTVKSFEYLVNKEKPIEIHNKNKKSASITVMLSKQPTPFAVLAKDKNPNTNFITKKFKLKFSEEMGWEVAN